MNLQWERDSGIIFIALLVLWIQPVSAQTVIMEETPPQSTAAGFDSDPFDSEEFVKYSATKSTMSGKFYKISCPGEKVITTKTWLLDELRRYRETKDSLLINED